TSSRGVQDCGGPPGASAPELSLGRGGRAAAPHGTLHRDALARAERALREFVPEGIARRLVRYVEEADDIDVGRMRPFALADAWGLDRREVLGACLAAVRAGLLELQWELICPSCRGAATVIPSLASLAEHGACHFCDIQFTVDLEEAVEATFSPPPAVRDVDVGTYCIGGPALTPHVITQGILPSGGLAELRSPPEAGRYRLFLRGGAASPLEVVEGAT